MDLQRCRLPNCLRSDLGAKYQRLLGTAEREHSKAELKFQARAREVIHIIKILGILFDEPTLLVY
jgi:hypothetical protein